MPVLFILSGIGLMVVGVVAAVLCSGNAAACVGGTMAAVVGIVMVQTVIYG